MRNFTLLFVFALFSFQAVVGQMDTKLKPKSTQYIQSVFPELQEIVLPPFSQHWADSLDAEDALHGRLPLIARHIAVDINLNNAGNWATLPDGGRVWRVQITTKNALGIVPLIEELYLPPGATLHVYMPDMREVFGAFTHLNTPEPRSFNPGLLHGESCIIEYYEPAAQKGEGILSIDQISHAYRDVPPLPGSAESGSQSCEVNVICAEGDNWRNQIRSVCRIYVVNHEGDGFCSGALVNNVRQDCTPYILSAGHCTDYDSITSAEFGQWEFYFNYQASSCGGTDGPTTDVIKGCSRMAYAYDSNGINGSDFLLLQLSDIPPADYNVYYSGWDNTGNTPASGVGIHHPAGDIKKISTFTAPADSASWAGNVLYTHWELTWAATTDGHGVTEPGSSGSPLYEPSGLIVGHLTGGSSCCTLGGCNSNPFSGPNYPDSYGRISYDWKSNGVTPAYQLQPWLDPDNTGASTLQGMNPPCGNSTKNNVGILDVITPNGNTCGTTFTPCFTLRNYGDDTLKTVTITYFIDNDSQYQLTLPPTYLPLPGGADTVVCLPSITVSEGAHTFTVIVSQPNGVADNNSTNYLLTSNFTAYPAAGSVNLVINTDNDGSQDTWQISQGSTVVASGGPFVNDSGGRQYIYPLCLIPGCYVFTIFDSHSNGMTNGVDGYFQIFDNTGSIITQLQNASFGAQEADSFCIISTAINDLPAISLNIIPNPSKGVFNVYFNDNEQKTVRLFDALGQAILEKTTGEQHFIIDMTAYSKGVYFAEFSTAQGKVVRKLVVE